VEARNAKFYQKNVDLQEKQYNLKQKQNVVGLNSLGINKENVAIKELDAKTIKTVEQSDLNANI